MHSTEIPKLGELPLPPTIIGDVALSGPAITPRQRIALYSPTEWEIFILEWAVELRNTYSKVKQLGGSGDRGIDVAGFASDAGLEGDWDLYQCKHYDRPLKLSDVAPEIVKVFHHAAAGNYRLPRRYSFAAPYGPGTDLNLLLSSPQALKRKILDLVEGISTKMKIGSNELTSIQLLMKTTDFAFVDSVETHEILEQHAHTKFHVARFGTQLPPRSNPAAPPHQVASEESVYVTKLVQAYNENSHDETVTVDNVGNLLGTAQHFLKQRTRFYSAESLRIYARENTPDGAFESLQEDIYEGVADTAYLTAASALERLARVIAAASAIDLQRHGLASVVRTIDRAGVCHQLANSNKLDWTAK